MHIKISISKQQLFLFDGENIVRKYSVSTAKNGVGERKNSECTPRGEHIIAEKIGHGAKQDSVFELKPFTTLTSWNKCDVFRHNINQLRNLNFYELG